MKTKEQKRKESRSRIKGKIRSKIKGTGETPRLAVFRSNKFIYAQLINDVEGKTLASATDLKSKTKGNIAKAVEVGKEISEKAKTLKLKSVVFDRGGFRYAGRIKALADSARESGLDF